MVRSLALCTLVAFVALFSFNSAEAATAKKEVREAKALFRKAEKQYRLGRFEAALKSYQAAYELLEHPAFLFNLAQCHRQLGNFERAVFFYEAYIRDSPTGDQDENALRLLEVARGELAKQQEAERLAEEAKREQQRLEAEQERQRIERQRMETELLRQQQAERQAAQNVAAGGSSSALEVRVAQPPANHFKPFFISGLSLLGAGVITGGIGTYFGVASQDVSRSGLTQRQAADALRSSDEQAQWANWMFIGAGASALVGGALVLVAFLVYDEPASFALQSAPGALVTW